MMVFLSVAGKERWRERSKIKSLVFVDDHSTIEALCSSNKGEELATPILALKDALYKVRIQKCIKLY